jgi:hypothetical protein
VLLTDPHPGYEIIREEIGRRLAWARIHVIPDHAEFAKVIRLDPEMLKAIEDGEIWPAVINILDIAYVLRVSCDYLLRGQRHGVDDELAALLYASHPELADFDAAWVLEQPLEYFARA